MAHFNKDEACTFEVGERSEVGALEYTTHFNKDEACTFEVGERSEVGALEYTTHFNKRATVLGWHGVPRQTGETVSSEKGHFLLFSGRQLAQGTTFF